MGNINRNTIIRWYKMLKGKSIFHVNQNVGKIYSKKFVEGYYNDLTEKVLRSDNPSSLDVPEIKLENGNIIVFPIAVFQYGLGSYDLYLLEKEKVFLEIFKEMADWALHNQEDNGAWNTFFYVYPEAPYSAMAQGEGASLLVRAYKEFKDPQYMEAAKKAINFMLLSIEDGGTTLYKEDKIFFQEYTHKPTVLNGWIFALFGLYDYVKISGDKRANDFLDRTLSTLKNHIPDFDNGYWSLYNNDRMITSPFYHDLHISQLKVLYDLFEVEQFNIYSKRWENYKSKWINRKRSFICKVLQKLSEK